MLMSPTYDLVGWRQISAVRRTPIRIPIVRLCVIAVLLLLLDVGPINGSAIAIVIAIFAAGLASLNPYTWVFYVAASQVVADPAQAPFTLAQIAIIAWIVTLPFNKCLYGIRQAGPIIVYVAPFLAWQCFAGVLARQEILTGVVYAAVYAVITFAYLHRPGIRAHLILLCLLIGTCYAVVGYWGMIARIPIIAPSFINYAGTAAFQRIGSGRGDANTVAQNVPVFLLGGIALFTFRKAWARRSGPALALLTLVLFALGIPALAGAVSRGGLYTVPLGLIAIICTAAISRSWKQPYGISCHSLFSESSRLDSDIASAAGPLNC